MAADAAGRADLTADLARRYAQFVAPTYITLARRVVDLAQIEPGQSVLDLCTGTGLAAFLAAERAGRDGTVIGLDPSEAMLEVARQRAVSVGYEHIRWQQGEAAPLTYAEEAFDAVLCVQGLMLLSRPDQVLDEVRRVLVEHGRLVATIWSGREANEWMQLLEAAVRRAGVGLAPPRPFGLTQPGNLEALLQAHGFEEIEVARVPDRMRLHGAVGFWEWACGSGGWGPWLGALASEQQAGVREALLGLVGDLEQEGELVLRREVVYLRAIAPESL